MKWKRLKRRGYDPEVTIEAETLDFDGPLKVVIPSDDPTRPYLRVGKVIDVEVRRQTHRMRVVALGDAMFLEEV